jgi:hypothetical protein
MFPFNFAMFLEKVIEQTDSKALTKPKGEN